MGRAGRALTSVFLFATLRAAAAPLIDLQLVTGNVTNPTYITHAGDGSGRLFIVEQPGRIKIFDGTNLLATPFLDVSSQTLSSIEEGLLSVAFHPGFATNGQFFVYFTQPDMNNLVARFTASPPNANTVNTNTMVDVLRILHPTNANHNGGQLQFGPDGYLYIGTGDGGSGCDPPNNAQDLTQLLGKLLRIDVDHGLPYTIPASNPFSGRSSARNEIWAYGLRNPWRFTFDRSTGDLWIGDVGQDTYEEIDLQPATSIGGENYGWRKMEGFHCYNPSTNCTDPSFTMPILEYSHAQGACSITGGYRYRGTQIPSLKGAYLYGDYCSGSIWTATQTNGVWISKTLFTTTIRISSFGEDVSGELYVLDVVKGVVYKFISRGITRRRTVR